MVINTNREVVMINPSNDVFEMPPRLLLINCNFGIKIGGGFRHSAYRGKRRVATIKFNGIMTDQIMLNKFRAMPLMFVEEAKNGN